MSHPPPHESPVDFHKLYAQLKFFDDMKGGYLEKERVIEARLLEMVYFRKMGGVLKGSEGGGEEARSQGDHHEVDRHQHGQRHRTQLPVSAGRA